MGTLHSRGTSLARKRTPLGPYRGLMPRVLRGSFEGGRFLTGEVTLYTQWPARPTGLPRVRHLSHRHCGYPGYEGT